MMTLTRPAVLLRLVMFERVPALLAMAFLVSLALVGSSSIANGQTTYTQFKAAVDAANTKALEAGANFSLVVDAVKISYDLEKIQEDRVKANWGAHFAGSAANRATRISKTTLIATARKAAMADLKSASDQFKASLIAFKAAVEEVKQAAPDWGRGEANANLANLKASASKDYSASANTGFQNTAVKIGEYKAWLDSIIVI